MLPLYQSYQCSVSHHPRIDIDRKDNLARMMKKKWRPMWFGLVCKTGIGILDTLLSGGVRTLYALGSFSYIIGCRRIRGFPGP